MSQHVCSAEPAVLHSPCRQAHVHFHSDSSTKSNSITYLGEKRNNFDKIINYVSV